MNRDSQPEEAMKRVVPTVRSSIPLMCAATAILRSRSLPRISRAHRCLGPEAPCPYSLLAKEWQPLRLNGHQGRVQLPPRAWTHCILPNSTLKGNS